MRLRTKLLLGFLTSPVLFFGLALSNYNSLTTIRNDVLSLQRFVQTTDLMSQASAEIAALAHPEDVEVGVLRAKKLDSQPVILSLLVERIHRAQIQLRSLQRLARDEKSRDAISQTLQSLLHYKRSLFEFVRAIRERGPEAAQGDERQRSVAIYESLRPMVSGLNQSLGNENRRALLLISQQLKTEAVGQARATLLLVLIFTVVIAYTLANLSARGILTLHQATRRIEAGDLNVTLEVGSTDEIGDLTVAFNDMTSKLRSIYYDLETQVQKRSKALQKRERELYEAQKLAAVGRLAAGVAHELGGPLTIIATAAEGLLDRTQEAQLQNNPVTEDFPDYLQMIETEAYRLKKVIRRLLNYARAKDHDMNQLDFREIVIDAFNLAKLDPRAKTVLLDLDLPSTEDSQFFIEGDPDRLREALLNLIFNALDACEGRGSVQIKLTSDSENLTVSVRDTGVGLTAQQISHIFDPFFTTKPEGAGTGLGLTLVMNCVHSHHGQIHVDSEGEGAGSKFALSFPLVETSAAAAVIID